MATSGKLKGLLYLAISGGGVEEEKEEEEEVAPGEGMNR